LLNFDALTCIESCIDGQYLDTSNY